MIARDDGRKSQTEKKYMCALRWRVLSMWSTFPLWYLLVFYISPRSMKWQYNVRGCLDLKLSQTKSSNFETIVNFAFMANRWDLFLKRWFFFSAKEKANEELTSFRITCKSFDRLSLVLVMNANEVILWPQWTIKKAKRTGSPFFIKVLKLTPL